MQIKLPLLIPSRNVFAAYKNDVKVFITKLSSFVAVGNLGVGNQKRLIMSPFRFLPVHKPSPSISFNSRQLQAMRMKFLHKVETEITSR